MLNILKNLFFPEPEAVEPVRPSAQRLPRRPGGRPAVHTRQDGIRPAALDTAFYSFILGVQSPLDTPLNRFEKDVLSALDQLVSRENARAELVPRLPAIIPRVMGTLRDDTSSAADLALEIGRDAVLVSDVLQMANSACYSTGDRINSLEQAIFILGRVGLRQLVTRAAFKPLINLDTGYFTRLSGATLWEQAEKTARVCDCLAKKEHLDRFYAYLAAIVQNVGFIVALRVLDRSFDGNHAPRSHRFRSALVRRARRLSLLIAREWDFPPAVLDALDDQSGDRPEDMSRLGDLLYTGDKLSKLHILSAQGRFTGKVDRMACRLRGRLTDSCADCYSLLDA